MSREFQNRHQGSPLAKPGNLRRDQGLGNGGTRKERILPRKQFTTELIISKLREAEVERSRGKMVRQIGMPLRLTEQANYRCRNEYGDLRVDQASASSAIFTTALRMVRGDDPTICWARWASSGKKTQNVPGYTSILAGGVPGR